MKSQEIAEITSAKLEGDGQFEIESLANTPSAAEENQLALVFPASFNKAYKLIKASKAKVFLISTGLNENKDFLEYKDSRKEDGLTYLICDRPKYALHKLIDHFAKPRLYPEPGVHPSAVIDPSAEIHAEAAIGALSYIGPNSKIAAGVKIQPRVSIGRDVEIDEDTIIRSGVVIEDYVRIGKRVTIQPNAVIGGDGYSFVTAEPTNLEKMQKKDFNFSMDRQVQYKIASIGSVIIEDDVEIGSCSTIDAGSIGPTRIGVGTKIDNLCQVAHNVQLGKDCLIVAHVAIGGSTKIGDRTTIAGASAISDSVEVGNDVVVGGLSGVHSNVDPFMPMMGMPAIPYLEYMRRQRCFAKIVKHQEEMRKVKHKVEELYKQKTAA